MNGGQVFQRVMIGCVAIAAASCGGDSTGNDSRPTQIIGTSSSPTAQVATALATSPTFEVRDAAGDVLDGISVTVAVSSGGGTLVGAPTRSGDGPTSIGTWTLGPTAGPQTVTVSAAGVTPLVLTAIGLPAAPAAIEVVEGNNQAASAQANVPAPIRVRVRDGFGNGVPGIAVTWTVASGGGSVAASQSITDEQGIATAPVWTLGPATSDDQTLTASFATGQVAVAAVQSDYNIVLRFVGSPPSAAVQAAFGNAVNRLQGIITGDLINAQINATVTCIPSQPALSEIVDDIVIYASMETIDGPGNVLGSAGPCLIRNSNMLTAIGAMRFDVVDLETLAADGRLQSVILHEMLHVIGVGTLWDNLGLLAEPNTPTVRFLGPLARVACVDLNGGALPCNAAVPAENCLDLPIGQSCGAGTQNAHWKESTFGEELLTGYLGTGAQPLSAMTVQSLADLGYQVDVSRADAYTVPAPELRAWLRLPANALRMPEPMRPTQMVDEQGRVTRIAPQ